MTITHESFWNGIGVISKFGDQYALTTVQAKQILMQNRLIGTPYIHKKGLGRVMRLEVIEKAPVVTKSLLLTKLGKLLYSHHELVILRDED